MRRGGVGGGGGRRLDRLGGKRVGRYRARRRERKIGHGAWLADVRCRRRCRSALQKNLGSGPRWFLAASQGFPPRRSYHHDKQNPTIRHVGCWAEWNQVRWLAAWLWDSFLRAIVQARRHPYLVWVLSRLGGISIIIPGGSGVPPCAPPVPPLALLRSLHCTTSMRLSTAGPTFARCLIAHVQACGVAVCEPILPHVRPERALSRQVQHGCRPGSFHARLPMYATLRTAQPATSLLGSVDGMQTAGMFASRIEWRPIKKKSFEAGQRRMSALAAASAW